MTVQLPGCADYEQDEYAWVNQAIGLAQQGRTGEIDPDALIDLLQSFIRQERETFRDAARQVLRAMLEYQVRQVAPQRYCWSALHKLQTDLRFQLQGSIAFASLATNLFNDEYVLARELAAIATGKPESRFPEFNPWTLEEAIAFDWPDLPRDRAVRWCRWSRWVDQGWRYRSLRQVNAGRQT